MTAPRTTASVSIVVATRNRADKLENCIQSIIDLNSRDEMDWELICVDNNSLDNTKQVVGEFARRSPFPIVYVLEPTKGAARARNAGLREARGDIIAIIDDDCVTDPAWLTAIEDEFAADPELDILGGRVELYDQRDLPLTIRTFEDRISFSLDTLVNLIPGCNLSMRRRVAEKVGAFDQNFGPGMIIPSAEDTDLLYRAFRAECKIVYSPGPLVFHDHGRRTEQDQLSLKRSYIIGRGAFYMKHILRGDTRILRLAYWEVRNLTVDFVKKMISKTALDNEHKYLKYLLQGCLLYFFVRGRAILGR